MEIKTNINFFNRLLNIHSKEWPKVFSTLGVRFFFKASFVIAWTLIVTVFIDIFGVKNIPFLFIINAFFTIIASLLYSKFLFRYSHVFLITVFLFISGLLIFVSSFLYGIDKHFFLFFLIIIESIFLIQSKILLKAHIETRFSYLQGERIFPLTEAFETFGAILAGFILFSFSYIFSIQSFLYIWIIFLFLAIPFLIYSGSIENHENLDSKNLINFKEFLNNYLLKNSKFDFVKGLVLIVFLQWLLFNLIEYQYVNAIYSNISSVVLEAGSGFEHAFIHDLGGLFIIFSVSSLVCQILLASRILNHLGIIGSMLIHPIVTFFSFLFFLFNNGFYSILFAKNNYVLSSVVFNNAYHCSFYAVKEEIREFLRQFLEGIVRPIGAIFGTIFLFIFQWILPSNTTFLINFSILIIAIFYFIIIKVQKENYYNNAIFDFKFSDDLNKRKNAIEILSQKNGKNGISLLIKALKDNSEKLSIRIKIIQVLSKVPKTIVIKYLLEFLYSSNEQIKIYSLDSLITIFDDYKFKSKKFLFLRVKILQILKDLFKNEENDLIRSKIIILISNLNDFSALEFLLSLLYSKNEVLVNESIRVLSRFKFNEIEDILLNHLKSSSIERQIYSSIALYKIGKKQKFVLRKIERFLDSNIKKKINLAIYAIGELKIKNKKKILFSFLYSNDLDIKRESAIALSKMGYFESVPILLEFIFHENLEYAKAIKYSLGIIDKRVLKYFKKLFKMLFNDKINEIKSSFDIFDYKLIDDSMKMRLSILYTLVDDIEEIENLINS
jgi:HEAT repeat protein